MNALDTMLRPAAAMVNRQIAARTPARALCRELESKAFALRVRDTAIALYLSVDDGQLRLSGDYTGDPDVVATGSLIALARLGGPAGEDLVRDGTVDISGDAMTANRFRKLLRYGQPDLEEALSAVVGDAVAHGAGEFARGVGGWARQAGATMRQNIGEYLTEERRAVPTRHEADAFRAEVESLRDDVARFEARLRKLEPGHP